MFNSLKFLALGVVTATTAFAQPSAQKFDNIGRAATQAEVKAWDIDVRGDFKGLPKGQGSVSLGEKVWEAQCASCHGVFGESNEVFTPIIGNTSKKDMATGRVAALLPGANTPQRTTMMKLSSLSTLWDYINRAMPWTAPKSLTADEVYAVSAYILHLADVVPADYTLSHSNMAATQALLPNRNGKTTAHAMWPGALPNSQSKPDVQGTLCMSNCATAVHVSSALPDYARNAHGNLADQSRVFGPIRGADTTVTAMAKVAAEAPVAALKTAASSLKIADIKMADIQATLNKYACTACHAVNAKGIGPSFKSIVEKQGKRGDAQTYLAGKIKNGGQGVWGAIPMPAQALSADEAQRIAAWLVQGAN